MTGFGAASHQRGLAYNFWPIPAAKKVLLLADNKNYTKRLIYGCELISHAII
jgi:hypothetical protein